MHIHCSNNFANSKNITSSALKHYINKISVFNNDFQVAWEEIQSGLIMIR